MDRREGGKDTTNENIMNTSAWLFRNLYIFTYISKLRSWGVTNKIRVFVE